MSHTNICQRCGISFQSIQKARRFCGRVCANRTRAEGVTVWESKKCKRCGKEFVYKPYPSHDGREYCSRTCSNLGREKTIADIHNQHCEPPVTIACLNCHKSFTVLACYKSRRFCGRECFYKYRTGKPCNRKPGIIKTSFGKGGYREDIGIYVRSRWEANYARYLIYKGHEFVYEPGQFIIALPDGTQHSYTPDFLIDKHHYVEIKGWMRLDIRQDEIIQAAQSQLDHPLALITKSGYRKLEKEISHKIPKWEYSK